MQSPPVCSYEGSNYRSRFWEGQGRDYEDLVERIALRAMLPPSGHTLIDIGAGYGRLAKEFSGYQRVVLFDYSRSLLREAQQQLGNDRRYFFVAGNWYQMPFVNSLFTTMVQVRTIHHAADVPALLSELARIARPGGHYVLEFANKQNLKAILRRMLGLQNWSPFVQEPIEFTELNYDFHPEWMRRKLAEAGFRTIQRRAVSHFRIRLLKKTIPARFLAQLDSLIQPTGNWWQLTPSVFNLCQHPFKDEVADPDAFFACPKCKRPLGQINGPATSCSCGLTWETDDNFFDFKEPLPHSTQT